MQEERSKKILFIINPISGSKKNTDHEAVIREYFTARSHTIDFLELSGTDDAQSIEKKIKEMKPDIAAAVGGDGTVSLVARSLLGRETALGIVPAGSANGMAKELSIPEVTAEALDILSHGTVRSSDVINVNGHICLHLSDIGLNAQLVKHFEEGKLRGKWGYATKVLKTLFTKRYLKVNIRSEKEVTSHMALMIVLANARTYGTGAVINPAGDIYDGHFEVVVMRRLAVSELFKMWVKPQPFNPSKIRVFSAISVEIQSKHRAHFQVDGEYLGKVKNLEAHIMPGELKLIVP